MYYKLYTFILGIDMTIIITGATGSLGASLVRYFSAKGHNVIASGRDATPPPALMQYATYFPADIRKPFTFPEADICIHTAALSDDKASYRDLYTPNVLGTKNVAEAASHCRMFIQISSSSVYLPENFPITEELAGRQNNKKLSSYGRSKLEAEEILGATSKHETCFVLRPRAFYGPGDRVILPRLLKLIPNGEFRRPGKMNNAVSLTHYDNFNAAVELCVNSNIKGNHIFNVTDKQTYILSDVIRKIATELYGRPPVEKEIPIYVLQLLSFLHIGGITPLLVRSFTKNMVLDITKFENATGYKPVTDLDNALSGLGNWVRSVGGAEAIRSGDRKFAWM